jgi:hypothetical protein
MGDAFDCAIVESGELACWAAYGPDIPPLGDDRYQAIDLPCAITVDGALRCLEAFSETGSTPPTEGSFVAVSAMGYGGRGCAIRHDRTMQCWGDEGFDDMTGATRAMRTPPGEYTTVTVGETVACATRPDGVALCWGEDDESARPAPTMRFEAPLFSIDPQLVLRWDAIPAFGPIAWYDIDLVTAWNDEGIATGFEPWRVGTSTTEGVFEGEPGTEACWRARATDTFGAVSVWGGGCTAMPHDDAAFEAADGWSVVEDSRYYAGRALRATERGARLTIDVDAFGLALLATTCPDCGSIRIVSGGREPEWVDDVDLSPAGGRRDRAIVWHWDNGQEGFFPDEGTGHVVIEVTSNGKPVIIDGLLQGPSLDEGG